LEKPDWQITATTVYCDDVDDEVTLMVYADGTSICTGRQKYINPDKKTPRAMKKRAHRPSKLPICLGDDCPRLKQYQDSILGR
jgi:hypothetical protein